MSKELSGVLKKINFLINNYNFPSFVIDDVRKRLSDFPCDVYYAEQQLRYLEEHVKFKKVKKN